MLIIFVISKSPLEELTLETVVVVSVVDAFDVEFVVWFRAAGRSHGH